MPSFDVVSEINFQEVDNAVNQTSREISQRYDFRGTDSKIELDKNTKIIQLVSNSENKIDNIIDVLYAKAAKRQIDLKTFQTGKTESAGGMTKKCAITLAEGIDKDSAKKIVKFIKELKTKVQAAIHDDKVRITGKKRDDLQDIMGELKSKDFELPLQFNNFRD
ncbi:YajQ family cyclic di-GMP-binding protein [bacterium K02(2017)]|nr:YajQ family cyclic di-GMP-binding protein [bacterium K02(2017)]